MFREDLFSIGTPHDTLFARYIVNAAGVHADEVAEMIGDRTFRITRGAVSIWCSIRIWARLCRM